MQLDGTLLQAPAPAGRSIRGGGPGATRCGTGQRGRGPGEPRPVARAGARPQQIAGGTAGCGRRPGPLSLPRGQLQQALGALQAAQAQRAQAVAAFANLQQSAHPEQITAALVQYQQAAAAVQQAQAAYDQVKIRPPSLSCRSLLRLQQATLALDGPKPPMRVCWQGATPQLDQASGAVDQSEAGVIQASASGQPDPVRPGSRPGNCWLPSKTTLACCWPAILPSRSGVRSTGSSSAGPGTSGRRPSGRRTGFGGLHRRPASAADDHSRRPTASSWPGIEPGETALMGGTLLTLGDIAHLTSQCTCRRTSMGSCIWATGRK